jgi:hypothetical protein
VIGRVRGNLTASGRVHIHREGSLVGDVVSARISVEDGAFFKGTIDIRAAYSPVSEAAEKSIFTMGFDTRLLAATVGLTLGALAEYYRACGGVGFEVESHHEPVFDENVAQTSGERG